MKVLVLGATGYIGSALSERLSEHGHDVVALVRPKPREAALPGEVRHGDLHEPETLAKAVTSDIDVVVHAANPVGDEAVDVAAIEALAGGGARLVYISGVWVLGSTTEAADENAPVDPIALSGYRPRLERIVLDGGGVVVRPGVVYGRGAGIPALLAAPGGEDGRYVHAGGPAPTWATVHVDDLVDLIVLAIEKAAPGSLFHAVAEEAVSVADAAAAAGRSGKAVPWPIDEASEVLGRPFAEGLALSQVVSGDLARNSLGWNPSRPGLVDDVRSGSYATRA
ncbi:NAD-dependent epimerase/dehydratase family protein [Microbispora triticiradicis]|uniref:NAD-dependent epimerase/dehydratase family protein n=1 Tax=Microbispora triticiradicis TaxID=2200763 RepID=UPI001AD71DD1|nr:NAD-dependent epimerase/dehydratase family protein [Microbispora triticiradicis]MBO4270326.1 NAD-dependent epimerase/dehydratase family protein [Microbispora triticiradicis]